MELSPDVMRLIARKVCVSSVWTAVCLERAVPLCKDTVRDVIRGAVAAALAAPRPVDFEELIETHAHFHERFRGTFTSFSSPGNKAIMWSYDGAMVSLRVCTWKKKAKVRLVTETAREPGVQTLRRVLAAVAWCVGAARDFGAEFVEVQTRKRVPYPPVGILNDMAKALVDHRFRVDVSE